MKNDEYWNNFWSESAKQNIDIRNMSGWGNRPFQEMIFSINDIAKKLRLNYNDILLDVGCGAGLFEIAFTNYVKKIHGIDYSKEMVKIAKSFTNQYSNIDIKDGNLLDLPFNDHFFDKILVHGSIQYLNNIEEVEIALKELERVSKRNAIICLSLIPNKETKNDYLNGYSQLGLSDMELRKKIEANNKMIWFNKTELIKNIENVGFSVIDVGKPAIPFQSKYYFDVTLCNGKVQ